YLDEGTTRNISEGETEVDKQVLNGYFVPIERLFAEREFWGKLESGKYKFRAVFGEEAAKLYGELRAVQTEVIVSAKELVRLYKTYGMGAISVKVQELEHRIWANDKEDDELSRRVDDVVRRMERV